MSRYNFEYRFPAKSMAPIINLNIMSSCSHQLLSSIFSFVKIIAVHNHCCLYAKITSKNMYIKSMNLGK